MSNMLLEDPQQESWAKVSLHIADVCALIGRGTKSWYAPRFAELTWKVRGFRKLGKALDICGCCAVIGMLEYTRDC